MRKGIRHLLLGVGVALLAAMCAGGIAFTLTRPTLRGGTVFTYESKSGELSDADHRELVGRLQRRIESAHQDHVIVRPAGANRVEVVVPWYGTTDPTEANDDVRQLVRQAGLLEFRIVANPEDDREGIEETQKLLDQPSQQDRAELTQAATDGVPPFATTGRFRVSAAGDEVLVGYLWVELGEEEREALGLNEKYEGVGKTLTSREGGEHTSHTFDIVAATRGKTRLLNGQPGNLLYSRDHKAGRPGRKVDYFYLCRESPEDSLAVTGDVRLSASRFVDPAGGPAVAFEFVSGAEKFSALTERNRPTGFDRQVAIVLDGKVVSAPTLRDKLHGRGTISGNFTKQSAEQLVAILNSGPLNVELKPDPVNESPLDEAATAAVGASASGRAGLLAMAVGLPVFVGVLAAWVTVGVLSGRPARDR